MEMQETTKDFMIQIQSLNKQLAQEKQHSDDIVNDKDIEISSLERALREKDKEIQELLGKIENMKMEDGGVNNDLEQLEDNQY